ncbi:Fasciclin-like arabinogalactan protein [Quillaja saponaria]|uniref:Fasciclin-like arabinogalactan protein n=1 Tax=Quillaja saponaria TaxID=32244 RepID=A0AAD7LLU8_QUISA|nr:Fasciclin-like arabinogalactan protein [Quillaja saponaria]
MQRLPPLSGILALPLLFLFLTSTTNAHNITRILAKHPEFSTFNHYLTATHLASEINRRRTITILAIDNAAMASLLSKHLGLYTLKNVLSLHVLVDYFGAKKLHQLTGGTTLTASMFQSTGAAAGTSGYVNITNLKGGKVGFGTEDNEGPLNAVYVKSISEDPYNIAVLQISHALTSAEAEAPTPGPSQLNLTAIMSKQGCKAFADLLTATKAGPTFKETIDGGLTVFCPTDKAVNDFLPKYKNLTEAKKVSLLLYHGIPVYQSLQTLKSSNGVVNTLATDGANKYDFTVQDDGEVVTLETKVNTAKITGTLMDQDPLIVFMIDKVLMPRELFKKAAAAEAPVEAPAESPKPAKKNKKKVKAADAPKSDDEEADAPEADSDDLKAADDENGVSGLDGRSLMTGILSLLMVALVL